ncbi:MAG: hypothetical protein WC222_10065 [Parachlamydiales bacterium]|jgi:hypothetical protein
MNALIVAPYYFFPLAVKLTPLFASFWIGRKVAVLIQSINPNTLTHSNYTFIRKSYELFNMLCPQNSTRRRFFSVILAENGLAALYISFSHVFLTTAVPVGIHVARKIAVVALETGMIAALIDTIKKIACMFFIQPVRGYLGPADWLP